MSETLLGLSEVLIFGRKVKDLEVRPASKSTTLKATVVITRPLTHPFKGYIRIDGLRVGEDDIVLVTGQATVTQNGLYKVPATAAGAWVAEPDVAKDATVFVQEGPRHGKTLWRQTATPTSQEFSLIESEGRRGLGRNRQLDEQLEGDACFARIYGFSYEGTYYELPNPTLFLVHGDGESATDDNSPGSLASRAPNDPSLSGVGAADFQIADDIRVWAYDKADYTIRMDVITGQLEQILLDVFFEGEAPMLAGGRVAGGRVAGGRVAGGRVAGGRVAGGRVSGGRVGGSSD